MSETLVFMDDSGILYKFNSTPFEMGLTIGGHNGSYQTTIQNHYFSTKANSTNINTLTTGIACSFAVSNTIKFLNAGGILSGASEANSSITEITFVTNSSQISFGNLTQIKRWASPSSNSTTGYYYGGCLAGDTEYTDVDRVYFSTRTSDTNVGSLVTKVEYAGSGGSKTRAVIGWGNISFTTPSTTIQYMEYSTEGTCSNFATGLSSYGARCGSGNHTRCIFYGSGAADPSQAISYVTISVLGETGLFGNLSVARYYSTSSSSRIYSTCEGGILRASGYSNTIDYVAISTLSNASTFGNLLATNSQTASCSNSHGGL